MKRLKLLLLLMSLAAVMAHGEVWKGVNLDFITDAHQDLVNGFPCVVETNVYEVVNKFGDISEGKLISSETVSYDKYGYIDRVNSTIYDNEYTNGRIVKRTVKKDGKVKKVIKYDYLDEGAVKISTYKESGDLDEETIYGIVDGKLYRASDNGNTVAKFNQFGLPDAEFLNSFVKVESETTYEKKFPVKTTINGMGISRTIKYSHYKSDSNGNWISRIKTTADKDGNIRGGLLKDVVIDGSSQLEKRTYLSKDEYDAEIQRKAEEERKLQEEKKRQEEEKKRQEEERKLKQAQAAELAIIADIMNGKPIPYNVLKQPATITVDLTQAIKEIKNWRNTQDSYEPFYNSIKVVLGKDLEVYSNNYDSNNQIKYIIESIEKSDATPAVAYFEKLDSTLIVPREFEIIIIEETTELVDANSKNKNVLKPIEIKVKREKNSDEWSIKNPDKIGKAGYNVNEVSEAACNYIKTINPKGDNISLILGSYQTPVLNVSSNLTQSQISVNIPTKTFEMPSKYIFILKK